MVTGPRRVPRRSLASPRSALTRAFPGALFIVSATLITVNAWAVIALALWSIYATASFVTLAVVATAVGVTLAIVSTIGRWPTWGVVLAAVGAFTIVGVPVAVPGRTVYGVLPEPAGLLELYAGVALGWRQLLTIDLPVGDYQALLVPALVILLVGPLLTLTIALRSSRPPLAAIVPLAAFPLAIAFGPQEPTLPIVTALALAATLLIGLAVWRRHRRLEDLGAAVGPDVRRESVRAIAAAVVLVLIAGAVGVAAVALIGSPDDRTVLRTDIERPFSTLDEPSPLAAYRASFDPVVADSAAITVMDAPAGTRIRVATLDSYDGVVFAVGSDDVDSASGRFVRIPTERNVDAIDGEAIRVTVRLERSRGVWLPTVGEFSAITIAGDDDTGLRDRFVFNAITGAAAIVDGAPAGMQYTLDAVVTAPVTTPLDQAVPGSAAVPGITAIPESLREWIDDVAGGVEGSGPRLAAALSALTNDGYLSNGVGDDEAPSRSGHSVERLDALVAQRPMIGDAEQYAVAAALIARELGFPSRIVLGFGPIDVSVDGAASVTLLESDLTAWVEISTADDGWRAVDVVPERREIPPTEPEDPIPVSRPQNAVQPPVDEAPALEDQAAAEIERVATASIDPFWLAVLAVLSILGPVLLVAGLLASPSLLIVGIKWRRRHRRRHAADPTMRILGGWRDVTDEARDLGFAVPSAATRREVASALGRPQALILARVADRAVYAPEEPAPGDADRVWAAADALRASLSEGRSRRERWRAALSVRSLRRYPEASRTTGGRSA